MHFIELDIIFFYLIKEPVCFVIVHAYRILEVKCMYDTHVYTSIKKKSEVFINLNEPTNLSLVFDINNHCKRCGQKI